MPRVLRQRAVPESWETDGVADGEAALLVVDEDELRVEVVGRDGEGDAGFPAALFVVHSSHHAAVVAEELDVYAAPPRAVEDALDAEVQPVSLVADERVLAEAVELGVYAELRGV